MFPDFSILADFNIPKPLHGLNPRTIKGQGWWDEQRCKAYKKHNYHCWACGTHKSNGLVKDRLWLEAHEQYNYIIDKGKGVLTLREIVALCPACHNFIHSGRLVKLVENEEVDLAFAFTILHRGLTLLKKAGMEPNVFAMHAANLLSEEYHNTPSWAQEVKVWLDKWQPSPLFKEMQKIEWSNWSMIIDGKKHEPLTEEEWELKYD